MWGEFKEFGDYSGSHDFLLFAKSLSRNLESSPIVLYSKCVICKCGGNLSGLIITVNHMASCNLRNLLLKVWNLVQCIIFEMSNWGSLKRCHMASCNSRNLFLDVRNLVWIFYFWIILLRVVSGEFR